MKEDEEEGSWTFLFLGQERRSWPRVCVLCDSQATLVELLEVIGRNVQGLPLAVFCSSRDVLDSVLSALMSVQALAVLSLVSGTTRLHAECGVRKARSCA